MGSHAHLVLESHHQDSGKLSRPLALMLSVDISNSLADARFIGRDLFDRRPARFLLRDLRVPVGDRLGRVDARVDAALKDVGKVRRLREGLVEVARQVNVAEGGNVTDVEERDVPQGDGLLKVKRLGNELELRIEAGV